MRLGILTYHDRTNFGAQLQAASLQRYLSEIGIDAELIDFRPIRKEIRLAAGVVRPLVRARFAAARATAARNARFFQSIREMARLSTRHAYTPAGAARIAQQYDVILCGSDEVWNFGNYLGYMPAYILDFEVRPEVRRISYAASLGSYVPSGPTAERMRASLARFDAILVRDPATLEAVRSFGLDAQRVVDPTFLSDLGPIDPGVSDFIMLSGAIPKAVLSHVAAIAEARSLRILSPGYSYEGLNSGKIAVTPREWIGYVRNARFHLTSLFHGAALSMKYRTPFGSVLSIEKAQKVRSLLELFGEQHRLIVQDDGLDRLEEIFDMDFNSDFDQKKEELISQSKYHLQTAITGRAEHGQ